jgi:hypothetical protein
MATRKTRNTIIPVLQHGAQQPSNLDSRIVHESIPASRRGLGSTSDQRPKEDIPVFQRRGRVSVNEASHFCSNQPINRSSGISDENEITRMKQQIDHLANMLTSAEEERRTAEEEQRKVEEERMNDRNYLLEMAQRTLSESRYANQIVLDRIGGMNDESPDDELELETPDIIALRETSNQSNVVPNVANNQGISFDSIKDSRVRLPEFDGDKDYDQWFDVCVTRLNMYNLREEDKVKMINSCLVGNARKYLLNKKVKSVQTLSEFDKILRPCFSDRVNWHSLWTDLVQGPDEKVQTFAVRIRIAAAGCGFGEGTDKQCVQLLRKKAAPEIQRALLGLGSRKTFDECVEHAIDYERSIVELEKIEKRAPKRKVDDAKFDDENYRVL